MKKMRTAIALLGLSLPVMAQGMEFQTPGTLGMGRAGVARTTDAYATFINPAGLAFYEKAFSMKLGAGVGVAISSSLADNIDKVGKLDLSTTDMNYGAGATPQQVADATAKSAQFAAIIGDLAQKDGNLAINVDLALGFQYHSYGLGIIGTTELGAGIKDVDTKNLRIGSSTTNGIDPAANVNALAADMGITAASPTTSTGVLFTATQFNQVVAAFQSTGASATTAAQLAVKLETELAAQGINTTGLSTDQLVSGLTLVANTINPANDTIDNNNSKVVLGGLALVEVPLAYGHKFDLGSYGKLGIGAAAKVMQGSVYYNIVKVSDFKDSSDVTDKAKDKHAESTTFGIDLGALYRLEDVKYVGPINVGLALKNLNSPKFDGPTDPTTLKTYSVKVEPQARLGVALDPLSWLSLAADMDLTKNKTILPGRDSQLIGGGLEAHFDYWYALYLALRGGVYKNIGETGSKPIITAGLSLGPKWLRLDINGAFATEKARYDNKSYPNEAKVEFALSTAFF